MAQDPTQDSSNQESKTDGDPPKHAWDIETEEEKQSILKNYEKISLRIDEIRTLYLDSKLYLANTKKEALLAYINETYPADKNTEENSKIIAAFNNHPRIISIEKDMKEMKEMLDFMTGDGKTNKKNGDPKGWQLISETETWKSEFMESKETATHSFRVTAIGQVNLFYIVPVIYEMNLMHTWMPLAKESFEFHQSSLYCKSGMVRIGVMWPMADREAVLFGYGIDDLENGKILVYFDSREENKDGKKLDDNIIPKARKDRVRVDIYIGGFYFEKINEKTTKITAVWNADPKIQVPYGVLNWFSGHFVNLLLSRIINTAKKIQNEPLNNPYIQRIKDNPYFYDKMKLNINSAVSTSKIVLNSNKINKSNDNINTMKKETESKTDN